jgi:hypothetical protein
VVDGDRPHRDHHENADDNPETHVQASLPQSAV